MDEELAVLAGKLHPRNFTAMSGRMAAILGYVLGQDWVEPKVAWLAVDSGGNLVSDAVFIGSLEDYRRNLDRLFDVAEVTLEEVALYELMFAERVDDWYHGERG